MASLLQQATAGSRGGRNGGARLAKLAALSPQERQRSREIRRRSAAIYEARRRALYVAADRTVLILLPIQWLAGVLLALAQAYGNPPSVSCAISVGVGAAALLGGVINGVPFALAHYRPGSAITRFGLAMSLALFHGLLLYVGGERFNVHLYVFISLALLTFYRDWRLLAVLAFMAIAAEYSYVTVACAAVARSLGWNPESLVEFGAWVLLETGVLVLVCNRGTLLFRTNACEAARLELEREEAYVQVVERTKQLEASNEQYRALLESTSAVPWELDDASGACTYIGAQVERQWGWTADRFRENGFLFSCVHPDDRPAFAQALEEAVRSHDVSVECRLSVASGGFADVRSFVRHAPNSDGGRKVCGISIDITRQKKLESELHQAQKLESVGRLAAGVAHEINTPVQFVSDSCYFLKDAVGEVNNVLGTYRDVVQGVAAGSVTIAEALERATAAERAADVPFLIENMPSAVERSLEGLDRVATIVRSMKEFSHPKQDAPSSADLNAAIASTLTIARNEYKYVADLVTHFGDIPPVICYVGEFNQALLNIVVNAAHAIGDVIAGTDHKGLITITSFVDGNEVAVSIKDTGGGIPEEIRNKVFDPFFTTKEIGKGTGQGLAIARSIIVDKHKGRLTFETERGVGTTFLIRLPLEPPRDEVISASDADAA